MTIATTTSTLYVIHREVEALGVQRRTGEVVDTAEWRERAVKSLQERRYLSPLPHDADEPVVCNKDCDRSFIDKDSLVAHLRADHPRPKKGDA